jgi:predicted lipoprotein with Yx(FWY)xxD motif
VKRICILLLGVLLAAMATSVLASADSQAPSAQSALFHTVELRKTKLGKILVNSAGSILYEFTKDHPKKDVCVTISGCPSVWVAMAAQRRPSAGPGIKASLLSSTALPGGISQVTYAGHPLYIYAAAPKLTSYVGVKQFGGKWYAINAKGQAVK